MSPSRSTGDMRQMSSRQLADVFKKSFNEFKAIDSDYNEKCAAVAAEQAVMSSEALTAR